MAAVPRRVFIVTPTVVGNVYTKFHGGDEARGEGFPREKVKGTKINEPQHGRRSMELTIATTKGLAGANTEPSLVGDGGTHEARGLIRREVKEDLLE